MVSTHTLVTMGMAAALAAAQVVAPPELSAALAHANVSGTIVGWCRGQFRDARPNAYVVAVASAAGGGRYVALDGDAGAVELAPFKGAPDLACYTAAEARTLNESIRTSATISGRVAPTFTTTVVCGFIDDTNAVCWQYSPTTRGFVKVGEWQA